MADMLFYSHLTFRSQNTGKDVPRIHKLLQEMNEAPDRWQYLHFLSWNDVSWREGTDWSHCVSFIREAVRKGSVLQQLALNTENFYLNETILETIAILPLKSLDLSGVNSAIGLRKIWKYLSLSTLQHICLNYVTWREDFMDVVDRLSTYPDILYIPFERDNRYHKLNHPDENEQLPPIGRMKNLKSLALPAPALAPDFAKLLFLWPAHLTNLTLLSVDLAFYCGLCSAPVIGALLKLHENSLEMVKLPSIPDNGLPDFHTFFKLTDLHLHESSFFNTTTFDACFKLGAPFLKCLTIDFTEQKSSDFKEFGNPKAELLKQFIIAQSSSQPKMSLEEVFLQFCPRPTPKDSFILELWSADLVEEVSAAAALSNISLKYNKPVYVEDEYSYEYSYKKTVLSRNQRIIFDILLDRPTCYTGVRIDEIQSILGWDVSEIESTMGEMNVEIGGRVRETVDDKTYSILGVN